MNLFKVLPAILLLTCIAPAQDGPDQKPNVFLQNDRVKNQKESNTRTIDGTVKDASDNPLADAIVQLKDTKTSNIVNFATEETMASTCSAIFPWTSITSCSRNATSFPHRLRRSASTTLASTSS